MCKCGTVWPALAPSLMPMLYPAGAKSACTMFFAFESKPIRPDRSASVISKNEATCLRGITSMCPGETGYASRIVTPYALQSTNRLSGKVQNGQSIREFEAIFLAATRHVWPASRQRKSAFVGYQCPMAFQRMRPMPPQ